MDLELVTPDMDSVPPDHQRDGSPVRTTPPKPKGPPPPPGAYMDRTTPSTVDPEDLRVSRGIPQLVRDQHLAGGLRLRPCSGTLALPLQAGAPNKTCARQVSSRLPCRPQTQDEQVKLGTSASRSPPKAHWTAAGGMAAIRICCNP